MNIHFDYNIGDKVKLTKELTSSTHKRFYEQWNLKFEEVKDREYVVEKYGISVDELGHMKIYYKIDDRHPFDRNYHSYIDVDCKLPSDYLEGVGEVHPFDEDIHFTSKDGKEIQLGDKVYWGLYINGGKPNISFVFTGYGEVIGFEYYMQECHSRPIKDIITKQEFLCTLPDGNPCGDANRYGTTHWNYANTIMYGVDDHYIWEYAKLYKSQKKYYTSKYDVYKIEQMLKHLGIYDKVMELVDKLSKGDEPKKKASPKKKIAKTRKKEDDKLEKLLSGLSEEELKKLKAML